MKLLRIYADRIVKKWIFPHEPCWRNQVIISHFWQSDFSVKKLSSSAIHSRKKYLYDLVSPSQLQLRSLKRISNSLQTSNWQTIFHEKNFSF
jgi:hypothetical protein